MKKLALYTILIVSLVFAVNLFAQNKDYKPTGFINDYTNTLSQKTKMTLEGLSRAIEKKTSAEIVVAIVSSVKPDNVEGYAVKLFEQWGVGKKGKDNGVLLLVAKNDKKLRIEVGYGLEGALPDGLCGEIIRTNITPNFKQGDFDKGIFEGLIAISDRVAKEYGISLQDIVQGVEYKNVTARGKRSKTARRVKSLFSLLILLLFVFGRIGLFPFLLFGGMGRGSYWNNDDFGSGFGGGFGGFGGGFSGGGGASGSW